MGAHPERFRACGRAHPDRDHGELSARRWRRGHPGGVAAVHGRTQGHRTGALILRAGKIRPTGEVTERLNVPVSKTGIRASVSWVRIPPSPPRPIPRSPRTSRKIQFLRLASRFAYDLTSSIFMLRYIQNEKRR